jgi:ferric-dicitrate binding protein FerR (iron transport regulator)
LGTLPVFSRIIGAAMNIFRNRPQFIGGLVCLGLLPITIMLGRRDRDLMVGLTVSALYTTVVLPDGSRAVLSRGSKLRYRRDFPVRRTLWVFGQGTFQVVPGTEFTVWTETALAKTSGGRFSVTAASRQSTIVIVRTGSVTLRALNEDNDPAYPSVVAVAGQRAIAARTVGARLAP